jgi:hypothetical protein
VEYGAHCLSQTNPVFYTLNTANGLSYIGVNDICIGQKGIYGSLQAMALICLMEEPQKNIMPRISSIRKHYILSVVCDALTGYGLITAGVT